MFDQKKVMEELEEIKKSLETSPENYSEMQGLSDVVRSVNVNAALIAGVVGLMQTYTSNMADVIKNTDLLVEEIKELRDHVEELYRIIYELAPDYEIIETMAETDEERRALCDAYMNHGDYVNAAESETENMLPPRARETVAMYKSLIEIGIKAHLKPNEAMRNARYLVCAYLDGNAAAKTEHEKS